jgi:hypothetical protein
MAGFKALIVAAALAMGVSAHGYVDNLTIAGIFWEVSYVVVNWMLETNI